MTISCTTIPLRCVFLLIYSGENKINVFVYSSSFSFTYFFLLNVLLGYVNFFKEKYIFGFFSNSFSNIFTICIHLLVLSILNFFQETVAISSCAASAPLLDVQDHVRYQMHDTIPLTYFHVHVLSQNSYWICFIFRHYVLGNKIKQKFLL